MTLTKFDLKAIDEIVIKRVRPLEKGQASLRSDVVFLKKGQVSLKKGQKRIENKFDELFNFLDKDVSHLKKRVAYHLGVNVSEFHSPLV